jgi:hypothetical protein
MGVDNPYLLGILNSKLFWFAISNISIPFGIRAGEYRYRLIYQYMEKVPIRVIDQNNKGDKATHGEMTTLVDQMLTFSAKLTDARTDHEKNSLQRQIESIDQQINQLVFELYGLTDTDTKIINGA